MREIRVFVSSPADVVNERQRAARVVERLNGQYAEVVKLVLIRWEQKFYDARESFQAQIPEAANCDLVIGILWSRLGTKLPPDMPPMPSGEPYPSGTAFEVLTAIEQSKETGRQQSYDLRERMRSVDLDTINFEFGSWEVAPEYHDTLEQLAEVINRILEENPEEVFLIEAHTDAVGSEIDNLSLSDRRAEAVAIILTDAFGVPAENLVTQGYGNSEKAQNKW
jgi:outer membrane protein OmpA-like peptidoglycan-associated protein